MFKKAKNKIHICVLLAGIFLLPASAHASGNDAAASPVSPAQANPIENFIQTMGDEVISYIANPGVSDEQEKMKLREVLDKNFDMYTISRFTLGNYWEKLTPEQQEEYRTLFDRMIVSIYADKFSYYDGQKFKVTGVRSTGGSDYIVTSLIIPSTGDNVTVNWHIRARDNQYKIIDVAINDISMIITQRSDFASIIQRSGGNAPVILDYLREKTKEPA